MNKMTVIISFVGFVVFAGIMTIIGRKRSDDKYLKMEFNGKIEYVVYDIKEMPTVTIKGNDYFIGGLYNFNHNLEIGDSLIKKKGDYDFKLIKKSSGKIKWYNQ